VIISLTCRYQLKDPSPEMAQLPEFQDFLRVAAQALQVGSYGSLSRQGG
jgi:hypothetical protein